MPFTVWAECFRSIYGREQGCNRCLLCPYGDFGVAVGCFEADVPQPCPDDINLYALFQQPNCCGVAAMSPGT